MIVFSFLLVLAALGLLVVGLLGASQVLVWASIAASVAAGLCLIWAVLQQRRAGYAESDDRLADLDYQSSAQTAVIAATPDGSLRAPAHHGPASDAAPGTPAWAVPSGPDEPDPAAIPDTEWSAEAEQHGAFASGRQDLPPPGGDLPPDVDVQDPVDEPAEEAVSASDVLRTADLTYDVLVVDGRPRYHLVDCAHLRDREPVSLPLAEARESGFTPCALCRPDSTLAARTRERFGD